MWLEQIRDFTRRRTLALVIASGAIFVTMAVLWLSVSTRAAILNRQLDELEGRRYGLEQEITQLQEQIGDQTSVQVMDQRMRAAGFQEPDNAMFLIVPTSVITASVAVTSTTLAQPLAQPLTTPEPGAAGAVTEAGGDQ